MRGVWKIATIVGIPVQIHWSFSFLFFWVYFEGFQNGLSWKEMFTFGMLLMALFACVVLHEFGHALAARYYGVSTKDITLSPVGGVARLSKLPEKPFQEFVVALAGPLVNIAIAGFIGLVFILFSITFLPVLSNNPTVAFSNQANFFQLLLFMNIILAGFNLIPAFPMDGGRMLRSLLSIKLGRIKATRIAALIGQLIAILFLVFAIYHGDILFGALSLFVFFMATHENYMVRLDDLLNTKRIGDLGQTSFTSLQSTSKMQSVIDVFSKGDEKNFLVFNEEEKFSGVLEGKVIQKVISQKNTEDLIADHLTPVYSVVLLEDNLNAVYSRVNNEGGKALPVYSEGSWVGVIDTERIDRFVKEKMRTRFSF